MHRITVNGKTEYVKDGTLLSSVLLKSGESVPHPCGGKGICRKCIVSVNGRDELACRYEIHSSVDVVTENPASIHSPTGAVTTDEKTRDMCLALDIGTTTIALALVSADKKEIVRVITETNPQSVYGADVISRIEHCRKNGVSDIQKILIEKINSMIKRLSVSVTDMYVSGNTVMLHILLGEDCTGMAAAPYTPVFLGKRTTDAASLGINNVSLIHTLPCISPFVGADITAGINYIDNGKCNLLVDLGTNAEIVLIKEDSFVCTSAAAGPCFEGVSISSGMSATDGAIYSYSEGRIRTIGNSIPKGICGTGLIDIIAFLLRNSVIDENGFMECDSYEVAEDIFITQEDIRQFQYAKSAIYSAILTLVTEEKIPLDKIENIYISGGFSSEINIKNAVATGLLPKEAEDRCIPVNNSSLMGTVKYIYEKKDLNKQGSHTDLSSSALFSDLFIKNMSFTI